MKRALADLVAAVLAVVLGIAVVIALVAVIAWCATFHRPEPPAPEPDLWMPTGMTSREIWLALAIDYPTQPRSTR